MAASRDVAVYRIAQYEKSGNFYSLVQEHYFIPSCKRETCFIENFTSLHAQYITNRINGLDHIKKKIVTVEKGPFLYGLSRLSKPGSKPIVRYTHLNTNKEKIYYKIIASNRCQGLTAFKHTDYKHGKYVVFREKLQPIKTSE